MKLGGLSLFTRDSGGGLVIASYTGKQSYCWVWSLSLIRSTYRQVRGPILKRAERRTGQWHDYLHITPRHALLLSRQDYHRDSRHQRSA
jgi:hypothetical protein